MSSISYCGNISCSSSQHFSQSVKPHIGLQAQWPQIWAPQTAHVSSSSSYSFPQAAQVFAHFLQTWSKSERVSLSQSSHIALPQKSHSQELSSSVMSFPQTWQYILSSISTPCLLPENFLKRLVGEKLVFYGEHFVRFKLRFAEKFVLQTLQGNWK